MVIGLVSTLALALAFGPQLQVSLQSAAEETLVETPRPQTEAIETQLPIETDTVDESIPPRLEVLDETPIIPDVIADPEFELEKEAAPVVPTQTDPVPAVRNESGEIAETEWPVILEQTSAALTAVETARGTFGQSNPDRSVVTGTFALNRPGRMRFEYDDPTPVLIVSDGTTVAMQDTELDTVDRVPIGSTPLGLILATDLNVDEDVEVLSIMQNSERLGIRVEDSSGELEGTLTMVFDKTSYALLGWLATDGNDQTTVVDLLDIESNVRVDPRLFRLNEDDER